MRKLIFGVIFGLAAYPTGLFAATKYVSPSGSDSNSGSDTAPWLTLQHAADSVAAGDTVIVRAGTYVGFIQGWDFTTPGTSSKPITFKADPGATINHRNNKTPDGIDFEPGVNYWVVDGFTIRNDGSITRAGIRYTTNIGGVVRNNNIDGMGTWGINTSFGDKMVIEGNLTAHSGSQHGIYYANSGDDAIIRYNISFGNAACGIHMNGDASQGGDGIISRALVEGNIIYDNGLSGGGAINMDGVQDSIVRNNILYNNHATGITMYMIDAAEGPKNMKIYNNTIDMPSNGRWDIRATNTGGPIWVRNNILYNAHGSRGCISMNTNTDVNNMDSDYNVMKAESGHAITPDDDGSYLSFSEWQAMGKDAHSFPSTPDQLFINAGARDYHLKDGSPAIDAGTTLPDVLMDFWGGARPFGMTYDIGAHEFGSTPTRGGLPGGPSSSVRVIPSPWLGDRHQGVPIVISGLAPHSAVHIFNIKGKEMQSLSVGDDGSARWNVPGNIVSGIYPFRSGDVSGKIAIIH